MTRTAQIVLSAAVGGLLLSRRGRGLLSRLRRDPYRLPKGVQEYPPTLVDRRHTADGAAVAPPASSAEDVVGEHYLSRPAD
ncbi:MAG: hypothetical protein JWN08_987 [Frankiales bacterium]|nr:hypothetical protein [Frankiales bacterium]